MIEYGIEAVPFAHPHLDEWRANFKGVQYLHEPTNFIVTGAVDDLWVTSTSELIVVDYKATATPKEIQLDDSDYKVKLKKQIEVYQWLLRRKGFKVSKTGYFIYCNADDSKAGFGGELEFSISVLPYEGNDSWVEPTLLAIHECLITDQLPKPGRSCAFCQYRAAVRQHLNETE
jgi:RecB family exonuclease